MADNTFIFHEQFNERKDGSETLKKVAAESGVSKYRNYKEDDDEKAQLDPNNLVSSQSEHRISDGQKRFRTLGKTTSSKYPRPKTLFKVFFEPNQDMGVFSFNCIELSKFVMSVTKPDVQYTTKEMNQYNRKKYIIEGVKYGTLKITFIDVKDNPIQDAFFRYLNYNNFDFRRDKEYDNYKENNKTNFEDADWGLNIDSSKHMFNSIVICEYFLNKLMVYRIENPTLKRISFGENKMGEYGYNEITVEFDVEGITNILKTKDLLNVLNNDKIKGDYISEPCGESIIDVSNVLGIDPSILSEALGMRWYQGVGNIENNNTQIEDKYLPSYINHKDQTIYESNRKIESVQLKQQEKMVNYANQLVENDPNKTVYRWIPDDNDYSNNNVLDVLLGTVRNPQDIGKVFSPRIKQLTDYFKF